MSLEWSTINECFSSPLQNSPILNKATSDWSEFNVNNNNPNTMSLPYQTRSESEVPNVAIAEEAFRHVINHENQYLYEQQENPNAFSSMSNNFPIQQEQPMITDMGYPTTIPPQEINIKSEDIRNQIRDLKLSSSQNQAPIFSEMPSAPPTYDPSIPSSPPRMSIGEPPCGSD